VRRSLLALLVLAICPSSAIAAPVLVLGKHGGVSSRNDPFVTGPPVTPAPPQHRSGTEDRFRSAVARTAGGSGGATVGGGSPSGSPSGSHSGSHRGSHKTVKGKAKKKRKPPITVPGSLLRLYRSGAISQASYRSYGGSWRSALRAEKRLRGTRRSELQAVTETIHQIAVARRLTASRLPALFQTLDRNRQWWTVGTLLSYGQRVEFAGSQLVWQYYPGQGIQLQVLGTFGKADGLYTAGSANYPQMQQLLSQMIPLAAQRGGGIAWEYYFSFDGGAPPWTSAMSQATGLEALTRAFQATKNPYYLQIAGKALSIFSVPPPVGVNVQTSGGTRFLQYTFAPKLSIINAFLQTLIGLHDYATVSGSQRAAELFSAGNAEALAELPSFDTGAWSLYQPGVEDTLSYHQLVTGFLQQLCTLTTTPLYCTTASHFLAYLQTPPTLTQLTFRGIPGKPTKLRFVLSKFSRVGVVISQGSNTKFETSGDVPYGTQSISIPALKQAGDYSVVLTAKDLAGNFTRITGTLGISGS
jgi:hypothetical protein